MKSNKKTIIFVIIFGIATLGLICFVIYFLLSDVKKDSQEFLAQKKDLVLLRSKIRSLEEFERIYQANQQNFEKIDRLFIDPEGPDDFMEFSDFLRKTAEDSQILISEEIPPAGPKKQIATDPWISATFPPFSFQGSLSNVAKFLEKLESAPYLIEISNFTIKRLTEKEIEALSIQVLAEGEEQVPSLDTLSANLSIKVFVK